MLELLDLKKLKVEAKGASVHGKATASREVIGLVPSWLFLGVRAETTFKEVGKDIKAPPPPRKDEEPKKKDEESRRPVPRPTLAMLLARPDVALMYLK